MSELRGLDLLFDGHLWVKHIFGIPMSQTLTSCPIYFDIKKSQRLFWTLSLSMERMQLQSQTYSKEIQADIFLIIFEKLINKYFGNTIH